MMRVMVNGGTEITDFLMDVGISRPSRISCAARSIDFTKTCHVHEIGIGRRRHTKLDMGPFQRFDTVFIG